MRIKNISASNFKGLTFSEDLAPGHVFTGRNFAGKSARTDACRLALLGYLPELGKTNAASFRLSSGREMEVVATFDDDSIIRRRFYAEKGGVKCVEDIPEKFQGVGTLAVMLDANQYFALSDQARVDFVVTHLKMPDSLAELYEHSKLTDEIAREVVNVKRMGDTEPIRKSVDRLISEINEAAADKDKEDDRAPDEFMPPADFLAIARKITEAKVKKDKNFTKTMESTVVGTTAIKNSGADVSEPTFDIATLDQKVAIHADKVSALTTKKAALAARAEPIAKAKKRRAVIDTELAGLPAVVAHVNANTALRATAMGRSKQLVGVPTLMSAARDAQNKAGKDHAVAVHDLNDMKRRRDEIEKAEASLKAAQKCPCCGAAGEGWKETRAIELASDHEAATNAVKEASDRVGVLAVALAAADKAVADLKVLEQEKSDLDQNIRNLDRALSNDGNTVARLSALRDEREALTPDDPALESELQTVTDELNIAQQDATHAGRDRDTARDRASSAKTAAEAEERAAEARLDFETAKHAVAIIKDIQARLVNDSFEPLLASANALFAAVLQTPLAYKDGEIGTWRGGVFVSHHTFSGTEKALAYAAISIALAATGPVKFLVIDELGRLDDFSLQLAMTALHQAIDSGRLDQFIGIDGSRSSFYAGLADWSFKVTDLTK